MDNLQAKINQLWAGNADMLKKVRAAAAMNPGIEKLILSGLSDPEIIEAVEYALQDLEKDKKDKVKFADLVSKKIKTINPHVIERAQKRFPQRIMLAIEEGNAKFAYEIYEDTLALPQTNTEAELKVQGYQINGPLIANNEELLICFDENLVPSVLKTLKSKEIERISSLQGLHLASQYIIKFKLVKSNGKDFIIMPLLPVSLESIKELAPNCLERFWNQMSDALTCFHKLGYAHMDVKPSNICIDSNGNFILIDLGSVVEFGKTSASTAAYIPKDLEVKGATLHVDWCMLAATISVKAFDMQWGVGASNPTRQKLFEVLEARLPQKIWNELSIKINN